MKPARDIRRRRIAQAGCLRYEDRRGMFNSKRHLYAVFMCHLSIEKALRTLCHRLKAVPPKTHNLIYLVEKIKLELRKPYMILFLPSMDQAFRLVIPMTPDELTSGTSLVSSMPKMGSDFRCLREMLRWDKMIANDNNRPI